MQLARHGLYVGARRRRALAIPAALSLAMLFGGAAFFFLLRPTVSGAVVDAYSGQPLRTVRVTLNGDSTLTTSSGSFSLPAPREASTLAIDAPDGYASIDRPISGGRVANLRIELRPTTLQGTIINARGGSPLVGVVVQAINASNEASTDALTDADGRFTLRDVPEGARLIIVGSGFTRREVELNRQASIEVAIRPDILRGTVRARDGTSIAGARIGMPGALTSAGADGAFTLTSMPDSNVVSVVASGYATQRVEIGDALSLDFVLDPLVIKSIYLTADTLARDDKFAALLALADRTEINAMVLDLKDSTGLLLYDSKNPMALQLGAVKPRFDVHQRLAALKQHGIYAIARVVAMEDPVLATKRPELAIRDSTTGGIWKTVNGVAWVNATKPEVWEYLTSIALEAADLGFDEVQFDYVRFPSDGNIDAIDLGVPDTLPVRTKAIRDFLTTAHDALNQRGVALSADIFGIAMWDNNDNGIGQQLEDLAPAVDYLSPMIYPSHFALGSIGFDVPNDHPYEVILESLKRGGARVANAKRILRPWLQDFSYGKGIAYGSKEVRAQIQATTDYGASGWLLWNANNDFTESALLPQGR